MAIAMMVDNPQGSQEVYEKIRAQLGLEKPAGGIFHVAGPSPKGGWRVIEVWESEEQADRFFRERFMPALEAVGLIGPAADAGVLARAQRNRRSGQRDDRAQERYDTVVIGGGQAGLTAGYYLAKQDGSFVILDANERVGDAWRKRWDSLRLFTPASFSRLPGSGSGPADATKDEFADYLEEYAARFELPVRTGITVDRLSKAGEQLPRLGRRALATRPRT